MNSLDFSFEASAWEQYIDSLQGSASAATLLALTEGEEEQCLEDALLELEERKIPLDISELPQNTGTGELALRLRQEQQLVRTGLRPDKLEPGDPLRLYLEEVAGMPAFGDEQRLAEEGRTGDKGAMNALVNLGLSRVIALAQEHVGYGVLLLDLIQEGSLGLWQAIQEFSGGDYVPFCEDRIRFYLAKAVTLQARAGGMGQKMREAMEDYRSVDERLLSELGRNPTVEEIAQAMHMSPETAATVGKMLDNARRLAQARKEPEPEEEELAQTQAVEDTAYFQMRQRINEMLSGLNDSEAKVISLRFALEGGLPLSPEDVGRKLGLTPQEVVAIEAAALTKMRNN